MSSNPGSPLPTFAPDPASLPPLVSIITPTFQRQDPVTFKRMLASVNTQTLANWEHIVASDGILERHILEWMLEESREMRIGTSRRYIVTAQHFGGYGGGVRQEIQTNYARGKYLCFLDDDNFLMPTYLEKLVRALTLAQSTDINCRFAVCPILHFGPLPPFHGKTPVILPGVPKPQLIDTLQVLVETDAMNQVGWIDPLSYISDGLTFEELARRFRFTRTPLLDEVLAVHL